MGYSLRAVAPLFAALLPAACISECVLVLTVLQLSKIPAESFKNVESGVRKVLVRRAAFESAACPDCKHQIETSQPLITI